MLSVRLWLPVLHLVLVGLVLLWDLVLAGRIAQMREAPRTFAAITGTIALLLVPATVIWLATSTVITGRAIRLVDWLWPALLVLVAIQAVYALVRRLVNPTWGVPIALYDLVLAVAGLAHYGAAHGYPVPDTMLLLLAAQSSAVAIVATATALASPLFFLMPMISPAFPALRSATATVRAIVAALAVVWLVWIGLQLPAADRALASYRDHAADRLTERPEGDFAIGLKVFPDIREAPPPPAIDQDLALADTLGIDVVNVVVVPEASNIALDSTAHAIDQLRRDSTTVIVTLGYRGKLLPELRRLPLDESARLAAVRRVVTRLHPDILLPAEDPYGAGARLMGRLPVARWEKYLTEAARVARSVDRRVRVGVSVSAFDTRDSSLYAWASQAGSPMDLVGFSIFPGRLGAQQIEAATRAADRWMRATPPTKDQWVFATGGFPLAQGERSQELALWSVLSWATAHPSIRGLVAYEAGDYGQARGLRAPSGRLRPATFTLLRAVSALRETAVKPAVR